MPSQLHDIMLIPTSSGFAFRTQNFEDTVLLKKNTRQFTRADFGT